MKTLAKIKRVWLKRILGALSFSTALFVFQACYGSEQVTGQDILIEGTVKSLSTGTPIKGIRVSVEQNMNYSISDNNGSFQFYANNADSCKIKFEDIDSTLNGNYINADTTMFPVQNKITLNMALTAK
jgi:hypothetical protein